MAQRDKSSHGGSYLETRETAKLKTTNSFRGGVLRPGAPGRLKTKDINVTVPYRIIDHSSKMLLTLHVKMFDSGEILVETFKRNIQSEHAIEYSVTSKEVQRSAVSGASRPRWA